MCVALCEAYVCLCVCMCVQYLCVCSMHVCVGVVCMYGSMHMCVCGVSLWHECLWYMYIYVGSVYYSVCW